MEQEWEKMLSEIEPFSCDLTECRGGYVRPLKESDVVKYDIDILDNYFYANIARDWVKKK